MWTKYGLIFERTKHRLTHLSDSSLDVAIYKKRHNAEFFVHEQLLQEGGVCVVLFIAAVNRHMNVNKLKE